MKPAYLKMLIVEDDTLIGTMIEDFFSAKHTYAFFRAMSGLEALEIAKRELPDIIITDIMLPRMSGIEMILALRKLDDFAVTPIIAITAGNQKLQDDAKAAGASLVIPKPFSLKEMLFKVEILVAANPFTRKR
jgi:DNA-binding response OmpR family regulator